MIKFYPDNREKVDLLRWYSIKRVMSFGVRNMYLTGGRGFGKTFSTKKICFLDFQKNNNQFFWARTTDTALENIRDPVQFFGRFTERDFHDLEIETYDIKNDKIIINKKRCAYLFAVSTFYNNKGADYNCRIGVWDEFIRAKKERPFVGKYDAFQDLCESVLRDRKDSKVIGLSNSTNKYDEVFNKLGINVKDFGVYLNREKNALIHYAAPSKRFIEAQRGSTAYDGMSEFQKRITFGNEFIDNDIYGKSSKSKYLFTLKIDDDAFISIYDAGIKLYVKADVPDKPYMKSTNINFVNSTVRRLTPAEKKFLVNKYDVGKVIFFDGFCRGLFQEAVL